MLNNLMSTVAEKAQLHMDDVRTMPESSTSLTASLQTTLPSTTEIPPPPVPGTEPN